MFIIKTNFDLDGWSSETKLGKYVGMWLSIEETEWTDIDNNFNYSELPFEQQFVSQ